MKRIKPDEECGNLKRLKALIVDTVQEETKHDVEETHVKLRGVNEELNRVQKSFEAHILNLGEISGESKIRPSVTSARDWESLPGPFKLEQCDEVQANPREQAHVCDQQCWTAGRKVKDWKHTAHLFIPLKLGWKRVVTGFVSPEVYYVAPCGKQLKSMEMVSDFLRSSGEHPLHISQFTFDRQCSLESLVFDKSKTCKEDISCGLEKKPIQCVNTVNNELPERFKYITARTHHPSVPLHQNDSNMTCCSCDDDCRDLSKCECQALTIKEAQYINYPYSVGYVHGRLRRKQYSGVFECNARCGCSKRTCTNRVVQHGLPYRLQVVRSPVEKLKWGVRTLDNITEGSFVCTYIGCIYTEAQSNKQAALGGDEYFAELDYIEMMQGQVLAVVNKTDSESPVNSCESSSTGHHATSEFSPVTSPIHSHSLLDELSNISDISDLSETSDVSCQAECEPSTPSKAFLDSYNNDPVLSSSDWSSPREAPVSKSAFPQDSSSKMSCRLSATPPSLLSSDWSSPPTSIPGPNKDFSLLISDNLAAENNKPLLNTNGLTTQNFSDLPALISEPPTVEKAQIHPSVSILDRFVRKNGECCFIMDAKERGNIGRFINHSCSPNLFVQNVFVDTHDRRFPWVALFAQRNIKAFEELTWDYNYIIGSVPDYCIECLCGSEQCRGRLL